MTGATTGKAGCTQPPRQPSTQSQSKTAPAQPDDSNAKNLDHTSTQRNDLLKDSNVLTAEEGKKLLLKYNMHPEGSEITIPSLALSLLLIAQQSRESMIADLVCSVALNIETLGEDYMIQQGAQTTTNLNSNLSWNVRMTFSLPQRLLSSKLLSWLY